MNNYLDSAIALTSICSVGLATLSFAEDNTIAYEQPDTVKNIQLQRLDNSIEANVRNLEKTELAPIKPAPQPVSIAAIETIEKFEGFESHAYIDTDGTPVIGYGLSRIAGKPVEMGDRISVEEADRALNSQLQVIQQELDKAIEVDLSDRQMGAVISLAYNVGVNDISKSTLVRKINEEDYTGAANEFLRWDKADVRGRLVQLPGLTRRRYAEKQLFLQDSNN